MRAVGGDDTDAVGVVRALTELLGVGGGVGVGDTALRRTCTSSRIEDLVERDYLTPDIDAPKQGRG